MSVVRWSQAVLVCTGLPLLMKAYGMHLFPNLRPVVPCGWLGICHGGNIYTMEMSRCHKSSLQRAGCQTLPGTLPPVTCLSIADQWRQGWCFKPTLHGLSVKISSATCPSLEKVSFIPKRLLGFLSPFISLNNRTPAPLCASTVHWLASAPGFGQA